MVERYYQKNIHTLRSFPLQAIFHLDMCNTHSNVQLLLLKLLLMPHMDSSLPILHFNQLNNVLPLVLS